MNEDFGGERFRRRRETETSFFEKKFDKGRDIDEGFG